MSAEILLLSNPRGRKKRKSSRRRSARRSKRRYITARRNPRRRSHSRKRHYIRARSNPVASLSGVKPVVLGGLVGAGGAVANDLAFGYGSKYLPAMLQTGIPKVLAKVASGVLIGVVGGKVLRGKGAALGVGAVTVALRDGIVEQLKSMPATASLPLGEYIEASQMGYVDSAQVLNGDSEFVGEYEDDSAGVGEYMGEDEGM